MVAPNTQTIPWYYKPWGMAVLVVGALLLIVAGFFGYSVWNAYGRYQRGELDVAAYASRQTPGSGSAASVALRVPRMHIETADDPALGPDDALVTIVEFGDFECPFCRESFPILQEMIDRYGTRIRVIFRDFPNISIHPNALNSALAAACADDQGKFWDYHNRLYLSQDALATSDLQGYASVLGLDRAVFDDCLERQVHRAEIEEDYEAGISAGVAGTPTWFVNGYRIQGSIPEDVFLQAIELGLAGKL